MCSQRWVVMEDVCATESSLMPRISRRVVPQTVFLRLIHVYTMLEDIYMHLNHLVLRSWLLLQLILVINAICHTPYNSCQG